jgi:MFS family permease
MNMLRRYFELLRRPYVARLNAAAVLVGLPSGMRPLAIVLFARTATGSYGSASIVAAGVAIGAAFLAPLRGRAVDRRGAGRVIPLTAIAHTIAVGGLIGAGLADAPTAVLVLFAIASGAALPPVGTTLRTLTLDGLAGDDIGLAMSMQAFLNEIFFFTGPLLAAALIAIGSPELALAVMAVAVLIGALLFAYTKPVREHRGVPSHGGRWEVLSHPGMRTLMVTWWSSGVAFGAFDVALPAFADAHGAATVGGVMLGAISVGVMIGSILFGTRKSETHIGARYVAAWWLGALGMAPVVLATANWQLIPLCLLLGLAIAPATVLGFIMVGEVTSKASRTEGASWLGSSVSVGAAAGAASVGAVTDAASARTALIVPVVAQVLGATALLTRRRSLAPDEAVA